MDEKYKGLGGWTEQIIAESLGKDGIGILPIIDEPFAEDSSAYNKQRYVIYISSGREKHLPVELEKLRRAGMPIIEITEKNIK